MDCKNSSPFSFSSSIDDDGVLSAAAAGLDSLRARIIARHAEATITGAKSMKGTPYWMAPEVVRQTSHRFSAGIWSVGCIAIEMAMARPPWNKQYEEFAALYHIATTKYHPPILDHLFVEEEDFLLKCLQM